MSKCIASALLLIAFGTGWSLANTIAPEDKVVTYPSNVRIKPGSYIVEFEEEARGANVNAFIANIEALPEVTISNQFTKVFNGFSVTTARDADPVELARVRGVRRVWPVRFHDLKYSFAPQNSTSFFHHHMTSVDKVLKELGIDGKGIKIGIVDSGVDYNHPELGACWKTPGCPWQYGEDFIGDRFDFNNDNPIIEPNKTPMDCDGHGTHVAGIIGGQGPEVHGVAPGATLGMYRVFSCAVGGAVSAPDDIILQGIEAAFNDGHDVISLSLGGGGWPEDPLAVACSKITQKGVVVVAAIGNDGSNGMFTAGSPAVGRGVISVGSVDNWNITGQVANITLPSGAYRSVYVEDSNADKAPFVFESDIPVVAPLDATGSLLGCSEYPTFVNLTGKIALIKRGTCTFTVKVRFAQSAGAIGVLIYNNANGIMNAALDPAVNIPVAMLTADDGTFIIDGILQGSGSGVVTIKSRKSAVGTFAAFTGGQMSSFSSFGPSPELDIDPVISAPGGSIWSTFPLGLGKYASLSGTSMATPYVSGTIALLKQARPKLSVNDIRKALMTSAKPLRDDNTGKLVHPYSSGSGLVNAYDAIMSRVLISPPTLTINNTNWGPVKDIPQLQSLGSVRWAVRSINVNNTDCTRGMLISLDNTAANSISMYSANGMLNLTPRTWPADNTTVAAVAASSSTLPQVFTQTKSQYIPAGQSRNFIVYIVAPYGLQESDRWFYGGFLNFTLKWNQEPAPSSNYVVPYAGFNGNYRALDVMTSSAQSGLPALADANLSIITDSSQLVIGKNTTAWLVYSIDVPTRVISATMLDNKNKTRGYLAYGYQEYNIRNLPNSGDSLSGAIITNKIYEDKEATVEIDVPPGKYHARLMALRPLGNPKNTSDYQIWDSPVFSIL
ncbi:hypothetical protein LPJ66_009213 [Kickxella alabastrina]|uniref:Uncharacterized protein n=1 Tax=Kickxella alabastrina TaxID=61397 RepID=A0ACC1I7P8_9FUNG|nr:hypothetical protein LPJ66_009213 [Kickxella alabastrina]